MVRLYGICAFPQCLSSCDQPYRLLAEDTAISACLNDFNVRILWLYYFLEMQTAVIVPQIRLDKLFPARETMQGFPGVYNLQNQQLKLLLFFVILRSKVSPNTNFSLAAVCIVNKHLYKWAHNGYAHTVTAFVVGTSMPGALSVY